MRVLLYLLVGFGLYSSGRLAIRQWTTGEACPVVGSVPACYVAFAGYLAMFIGLIAVTAGLRMHRIFNGGLLIAGGLALLGSVLELVNGNVCPRVGRVPMCYISLAMSGLIGMLFWQVTVKPPAVRSDSV
ncbi:MAG: hypothetical protein ABJZ55_10065 [Fuerstiella sp.]